jgi:hypothetical protein
MNKPRIAPIREAKFTMGANSESEGKWVLLANCGTMDEKHRTQNA